MNQQEEMRIAIAEACGCKWVCYNREGTGNDAPIYLLTPRDLELRKGGRIVNADDFTGYKEPANTVPNYCNDLNAMREAEMTLNADLPYEYGENLRVIAKCVGPRGEEFPLNGFGVFDIATLTAAQRAEAFCRTLKIGPFKEQPK